MLEPTQTAPDTLNRYILTAPAVVQPKPSIPDQSALTVHCWQNPVYLEILFTAAPLIVPVNSLPQ